MATAPSPNDLTRQQLDELDALLQRMLSLPLKPPNADAPPGPVFAPPLPTPAPVAVPPAPGAREAPVSVPFPNPPAAWRAEPPVNPAPAGPELLRYPGLPYPGMPAPAPAPPPGPHLLTAPVAEPPRPAPEPAPTPAPRKAAARAEPPVPPAPAEPAPPPRPEPVSGLLAPLVLFNGGLNAVLGKFGLPGRFLRSGFVKNLFGLAGLGLLAYAAAKVAQLQGWVSLPVQLPWPG